MLHARFAVTPQTNIRAAVTTALARPNFFDLAPHVDADLDAMERDADAVREGPFVFTDCKAGEGLDEVLTHVREGVLFA
jgi:hypothetical protein